MSYRATTLSVSKIVEVDETINDGDLVDFIAMANDITTEVCGLAGYTEDRLARIETLLAAHFYCCLRDRRKKSTSAGPVSKSLDSNTDLGFDMTAHGQMAKVLDTKGGLAKLDQNTKDGFGVTEVGITWLGSCRPRRTYPWLC